MIWLQLTANTGPAECCLGVRKAFDTLCKEAFREGVEVSVVEQVDGPVPGTLRSVLLEVGEDGGALAARWCGSLLWICDSPYRTGHKRKNWFLHGAAFAPPQITPDLGQILYEATRASGPGGQHVNKTDSAIRATHVATGLSVKVQTERSQHANKRIAGQLLAAKLAALAEGRAVEGKSQRRLQHWHAERGNAVRSFVGQQFIEKS